MAKIIFEQDWDATQLDVEDAGRAKIYNVDGFNARDFGMFVRVQSWDEAKQHAEFAEFQGKRLRVTVETIDD